MEKLGKGKGMAYKNVPQRGSEEWFFVADSDSDVTTIDAENPEAPVGSVIIADNSGSPAIYMKYPTAGWSQVSE